jgi:hypothetical protein
MMTKTILGIDPGANGAIAMLHEAGELLEVARHADDARGERQEAPRTHPLLAGILARAHARVAF